MPLSNPEKIRLTGSNITSEGRVEVYHSRLWGTVCDDGWDLNDANVVCGELGFYGAIAVHGQAHFGQRSGAIWLQNVRCRGNESSLSSCPHGGWGSIHNCSHSDDSGVVCQRKGSW